MTTSHPKCVLCGCEGQLLYQGQIDRLFGAPGSWDFKICSNRNCELVWLDPMPAADHIGKAYVNYYTHVTRVQTVRAGLLKRLYKLLKRGYWAGRFGYPIAPGSWWTKIMGRLFYLFPIRRREVDGEIRFLRAVSQGRLLDVGCGSGEWLVTMRELGWQVKGVDFDENATSIAQEKGLEVYAGSLEQQNFPANSFDAVTLNHVIEHVPDPVLTLKECHRILKPGGKLVLCTPNGSSLGRRMFKQQWRGLEPPRHLHIFSTKTIAYLLELSGFKHVSIEPQVSFFVFHKTLLLKWEQAKLFRTFRLNYFARFLAHLLNGVEFCLTKWNSSFAECMAAIAVRE